MNEGLLNQAQEQMQKAVAYFKNEIAGLRTGRASTALVEEIKVEYYGSKVPLKQLCNVSIPEANQILIQLWDANAVPFVEKAISEALSLNPQRQGNTIRINLPPLTQERRKELVKMLNKMTEEARVAVRNIRKDIKSAIESREGISQDEVKRDLDKLQKLTDKFIEEINALSQAKEREIMGG